MLNDIKSVLIRAEARLIGDILGAAALCVMLAVALHLPTVS